MAAARAHLVLSRVHPSGHRHDRGGDAVGGASLEAVQGGGDPFVGLAERHRADLGQAVALLIGQLDVEGAEVAVELGETARAGGGPVREFNQSYVVPVVRRPTNSRVPSLRQRTMSPVRYMREPSAAKGLVRKRCAVRAGRPM